MKLDAKMTAQWLQDRDNFLMITHRRPDGDTLCGAAALCIALRELGKTAYMLYNTEATPRFLKYVGEYWAPQDFVPDHTIAIDIASPELFYKGAAKFRDSTSLSIDHHPSNKMYAEYTCLDAEAASCGELIYEILIELAGKISQKTADCLYVAISTDTGCFAFANTTAKTLKIAGLTVEAGARLAEINRDFFRTWTKSRVKVEGLIKSALEFYFDDTVAIACVTRKMMDETGSNEDDMDDIASVPGSVENVLVGVTIRELTGPNDCKVSVRTSPSVSANALCTYFGGGGHAMAAGYSLPTTIEDIKSKLLEALPQFLPKT